MGCLNAMAAAFIGLVVLVVVLAATSEPDPGIEMGVACIGLAERSMKYPDTIDMGLPAYRERTDGTEIVAVPFTAQNAFGVSQRFMAQCQRAPDKRMTVQVMER